MRCSTQAYKVFCLWPAYNSYSCNKFLYNNVQYSVNNFFVNDLVHDDVLLFTKLKHIVGFEGVWLARCSYLYESITSFHSYIVKDGVQWLFIRPGQELDHTVLNGYELSYEGQQKMFVLMRYRIATSQNHWFQINSDFWELSLIESISVYIYMFHLFLDSSCINFLSQMRRMDQRRCLILVTRVSWGLQFRVDSMSTISCCNMNLSILIWGLIGWT